MKTPIQQIRSQMTEVMFDGQLVANIYIREVTVDKYFEMEIKFPNGRFQRHWFGYANLVPKQEWVTTKPKKRKKA